MKIQVLQVSVNPEKYDVSAISRMGYDEAMNFVVNEENITYMSFKHEELDASRASDNCYSPDGASEGDGSDANFVWVKVTP